MSGTISFPSIAPNARVPLFHVEFDNTQAGVSVPNQRTLIIGEAAGTLAFAPVWVESVAWARATFGASSMITAMIEAYDANDPTQPELWALPITGSYSAVTPTATITFTGPATAAGVLNLYINGRKLQVAVTSGMTATQAATAVAAAINAATSAAPYVYATATSSAGVVTVSSTVVGLAGNGMTVALNARGSQSGEATPAGLTVAIGATANGAATPSLSGLAAAIGDANFDFIVLPYTDSTSLTAVKGVMSDASGRWSDLSQAYGHVWAAKNDTAGNLVTFGASVNDQHLTVWGAEAGTFTPPWEVAAARTGAVAAALRTDPARPVQTLVDRWCFGPPVGSRFTKTNRQALLTNGIATAIYAQDGTCQIDRAITTYQSNRFGQSDQSYLDAETLYTLMEVTRRLRANVTQKYARSKLADDGTRFSPGQAVVTPKLARAELIAEYADMERDGLVTNLEAFKAGLIVQRNARDPSRLDVLFDPVLIGGLRIFAVLNQFRLLAA